MSVRPVILVATPDPTETSLLCDWLRGEDLEPRPVASLLAARHDVQARGYDVLLADAKFAFDGELHTLARNHNGRAPLIVMGGDAAARARAERNGLFHLDRPVDQALLLCHVAMAIAEGRPQRRSPRRPIPPFEAIVEGAQAYIVDVSNEGLRLRLPRGRSAPPPHFAFRVPLIGITLAVRRVWVSATPADGAWCGVELHQPAARVEQSWRTFVSTVSGR